MSEWQPIAMYSYFDLDGHRFHRWGGPPERFAKGHGPISDITRDEYLAAMDQKRRKATDEVISS